MTTQMALDPSRTTNEVPPPPESPHLHLYMGLCLIQGLYYFITGLWPLVSISSFQYVTGVKTDNWTGSETDHWLVNTVAVLVLSIGFVLIVAAWRRPPSVDAFLLAVTSAIGLTAIDVIYVSRRVIDPIYLLDALAEVILLIGWAVYFARQHRFHRQLALAEAPAGVAPAEPARVLVSQPACPDAARPKERV